jgi:hypothetical protein
MSFEILENATGNIIEVHVTGKLTKEAYEKFTPATEQWIRRYGKIRIVLVMHDFQGWTAGAAWEDFKFDLKHFNHIERLAIVGETKWEKGMALFCRPFTTAKIQYFNIADLEKARAWVREDLPSSDPQETLVAYTTHDVYEAEILRNELHDAGIACELDGESQGGFTQLVETKLLVHAKDLDKAQRLIKQRN